MKKSIDLTWLENMSFETIVNDHKLIIDADPESGGSDKGPRPKLLMLVSLAGCTAMDVVSILKKMRVEPSYFNVKVEGDMVEEHPKRFTSMKIVYEFKGTDLPMDKLQRAVQLSQETYCGVSATLQKALDLSYEIKILED